MDSLKIDYYNWNKQAQYLLDSILTGNLPKLERLNQYKAGTGTISPLILNKSSYNELLDSGNNVEIKDKQLKYEIVRVFQEVDIELSKLNSDNERFNLWAYNNVDVGLFHRLRSNRNLDFEDWKWLQNPASEKFRTLLPDETRINCLPSDWHCWINRAIGRVYFTLQPFPVGAINEEPIFRTILL